MTDIVNEIMKALQEYDPQDPPMGFDMKTGKLLKASQIGPNQIVAIQGLITQNIRTGEIGTKGMIIIKTDEANVDEAGCR